MELTLLCFHAPVNYAAHIRAYSQRRARQRVLTEMHNESKPFIIISNANNYFKSR